MRRALRRLAALQPPGRGGVRRLPHAPRFRGQVRSPRPRTASGTRSPSPPGGSRIRCRSSRTTARSPRAPAATATPTSSRRSTRSGARSRSGSGRRWRAPGHRPSPDPRRHRSTPGDARVLHPLPHVRGPPGALTRLAQLRRPDDPTARRLLRADPARFTPLDRARRRRVGAATLGDRGAAHEHLRAQAGGAEPVLPRGRADRHHGGSRGLGPELPPAVRRLPQDRGHGPHPLRRERGDAAHADRDRPARRSSPRAAWRRIRG